MEKREEKRDREKIPQIWVIIDHVKRGRSTAIEQAA